MAPRLIDLSKLSEKQLDELGRQMRKNKHYEERVRYRREQVDEDVFSPLARAIAKDGCLIDRIEENFKAAKFRGFDNVKGDAFGNHLSYYLGFLFETAVQMSILGFSMENPELLGIMRERAGVLDGGRIYSADSRGSVIFYKPADNGRALQTIAEIDMVGELHEKGATIPVMFEITLMNSRHRDFKNRRKAELLEEIYGRKPYFCIIRPAYDGEQPGAYLRFGTERGVWRDLLLPRNDAIRSLAMRLLDEEHATKEKEARASPCGA